ncbi:MAG: hypothetical protein V8Q42_02040 [Anaerovoracaceae bacterium]
MTTVELGASPGGEALNYAALGIRLTSDGLRLLPYAPASFAVNSGAFRSRWMI